MKKSYVIRVAMRFQQIFVFFMVNKSYPSLV